MKSALIALSVLIVLSGCMGASSPVYWKHKTLPSSQWRTDQNRCKRAVDKHLGLDYRNHADQGLSMYDEQMRQYEVGKKQKKLLNSCMRRLGYVPMN
ncbi:conserved exported hypothetical protein [Candidatus Terasakiella magnetica]|uniref:Lipoprotein n=1 Tax=Candidatus Terasakiella magnetica TaxID=1867952 RepID=A0A1C3RIW0_9PROT|nr:hypothetical protein [Candidatus Terasakiella magnetica]SCA57202.1 conserved exported hypothetical protein [Candidatus Terasakiella magnetica]